MLARKPKSRENKAENKKRKKNQDENKKKRKKAKENQTNKIIDGNYFYIFKRKNIKDAPDREREKKAFILIFFSILKNYMF